MATLIGDHNAILPIHFFKIIIKANVEKLKIPNSFTRRYGGGLSNPVFMKPPDGTEWEVYWTKENDEVWLEKGWKKFVENYSLDHGHFLVFKYKGTSQIDVLILDKTALEMDYPCVGDEEDRHAQSDGDDSVKILDARSKSPLCSSRSRKRMRNGTHENVERNSNPQMSLGDEQGTKFRKTTNHQLKGETATKRTSSLNTPRTGRAREVARNFVSKNVYFTLVIRRGELKHVPRFMDIEKKEENVMVELGEKWWPVKLVLSRSGLYDRFSSGWSLFVKESKLKVGDICVFELIDPRVPLLKVHVTEKEASSS